MKNKQMKNSLFIFILLLINILVFNINIYAGDDIVEEKVFIEYPVINEVFNNIDRKIGSPVKTMVDLENNCLYFIYKYNDDLISTINNIIEKENNNLKIVEVNKEKIEEKAKSKIDYFAVVENINDKETVDSYKDELKQNNNSNFKINNFSAFSKETPIEFVDNEKKKNNELSVEKGLVNNQKKLNLRKINRNNELKQYTLDSDEQIENNKNNNTYNSGSEKNEEEITYDDYEKYLEYLKNEYNFK